MMMCVDLKLMPMQTTMPFASAFAIDYSVVKYDLTLRMKKKNDIRLTTSKITLYGRTRPYNSGYE